MTDIMAFFCVKHENNNVKIMIKVIDSLKIIMKKNC